MSYIQWRVALRSHTAENARGGSSAGEEVDKKSQKRAYKTAERGRRAAEWGKSIQRRPVDCDGGLKKKGSWETKGTNHCLDPVCLRPSVLLQLRVTIAAGTHLWTWVGGGAQRKLLWHPPTTHTHTLNTPTPVFFWCDPVEPPFTSIRPPSQPLLTGQL